MTYEDAIRVADLKTRASRFARIRSEARTPGAVIEVTDYLKPDLDELYGILPYALVAPFARWAERRWPHGRPAMASTCARRRSSAFCACGCSGGCDSCARSRIAPTASTRGIDAWLDAVRRCAALDPALAREVAHGGQLVKGYGEVRRRMTAHLERLLAATLAAAEQASREGADFGAATRSPATTGRSSSRAPRARPRPKSSPPFRSAASRSAARSRRPRPSIARAPARRELDEVGLGRLEAEPRERGAGIGRPLDAGHERRLSRHFLDPVRARHVLPHAGLRALLVAPHDRKHDESGEDHHAQHLQGHFDFTPKESHTTPRSTVRERPARIAMRRSAFPLPGLRERSGGVSARVLHEEVDCF